MKFSRFGFTPQEHRISALPSAFAGMAALAILIFNGTFLWPAEPVKVSLLISVGLIGIVYLFIFNFVLIPAANLYPGIGWMNVLIASLGLTILTYSVVPGLDIYVSVLLILAAITSSIASGRPPSYFLVIATTVLTSTLRNYYLGDVGHWTLHISIAVISIIIIETVLQLKNLSSDHIRRLEIITDFGRQIASTIDRKEVLALLSVAFRNAVEADTYFVGARDGEELRLDLIYDDGESYENQRVTLDGTLSNWVINNRQSLFLPDLRREVRLPGVRLVLAGKHKTSLSWMGVPLRSGTIDGIMSIGSYRPNAFDRADLELLSNLAQYTAQALDNTYHHEEVELRSQLDSLTGAYNHGHFLRLLKEQADQSMEEKRPLSLIMLDVDHFKQYNDRYGHLTGDEVLTSLCQTIKQHIKGTDAVGRWGGEEFIISLPNTSAAQARQITERIRQTMASFEFRAADQKTIPVPTVSQGIAIFPKEADEIFRLIDLADQRLYIAKSHGRNQIEPASEDWIKANTDESK